MKQYTYFTPRNRTICFLSSVCIALTLFSSCAIFYKYPSINDFKQFPYTTIHHGDSAYHFKQCSNNDIGQLLVRGQGRDRDTVDLPLDTYLQSTKTAAFVVIRNDSLLFEKYYNGYNRNQILNVFSISKSVTSLLVGLAIEDGYIKSVNDPITKYIPELLAGDEKFQRLTIEDLLNMRSGLKFSETYASRFSKMAKLYYGKNQLGQIKKMKFAHEPGSFHEYQSVSTALLGIAVEKSTGKELGKYLEEKIWIPLGMEHDATWSLDDEKHRSAKAYQGLNLTAIDLAKIGQLYLNKGKWNGKQIINSDWIHKSTTPNINNEGYQYQWYSMDTWFYTKDGGYFPDSTSAAHAVQKAQYDHYKIKKVNDKYSVLLYTNAFYALGYLKQILYVDPDKNVVVVRIGEIGDVEVSFIADELVNKL